MFLKRPGKSLGPVSMFLNVVLSGPVSYQKCRETSIRSESFKMAASSFLFFVEMLGRLPRKLHLPWSLMAGM